MPTLMSKRTIAIIVSIVLILAIIGYFLWNANQSKESFINSTNNKSANKTFQAESVNLTTLMGIRDYVLVYRPKNSGTIILYLDDRDNTKVELTDLKAPEMAACVQLLNQPHTLWDNHEKEIRVVKNPQPL